MARSLLSSVREDILALKAYTPSPINLPIKLDAMESPYFIPKPLQDEWQSVLAACPINRYPIAEPVELIKQLKQHFGVPSNCHLLMGNGSDELIQIIMLAVGGDGRHVLAPQPSFAMYPLLAKVAHMNYIGVALDQSFNLDTQAMLEAMQQTKPTLICLAQPNNPTGNVWQRSAVEAMIQNAPGYVLLDEAYAPFALSNGMDWLERHENLLLLRTFSKIGFAGLRCGFLIGHKDIIHELNKVRLPYNIGSLVQAGVTFILKHYGSIDKQIQQICLARESIRDELNAIDGIEAFSSHTNFILFRCAHSASLVFEQLQAHGILLKDFSQSPGLGNCLRVSVGSKQENKVFIQHLKKLMQAL